MKVLAVSRNFPNPVRPFEGTWAYTQFKALTEYGADVRVLSPRLVNLKTLVNPSELSYFIRRPGEWIHADLKTYGPKVFLWKASSKLRHTYAQQYRNRVQKLVADIHRQWPFNVIYTQAINPDAVVALELARRHNAIAAGCIIGQAEVVGAVEDPVMRKMTIETIKELDCVFAESAEVARIAGELTGNCRPIHPLHRGTFPEDMTIHPEISSRWKKQFGFPDESVVVMFVGHLYKAKGVIDLLDAFRSVHNEFPRARLVFVGTGNQDKVLKDRVRSYSLDGLVYFTGPVPYDHIPSLMNIADFLCSPSHSEGLGLVNVEAGFCGKAVVGARTGGIPEAVCDGKTGMLFEPGNVDQLAEKLRMMLADGDMRRRMGAAAKAFVAQHHDAHKNTKLLYDCLAEAIMSRNSHD